jgi:20S proteasome subunit beta 7
LCTQNHKSSPPREYSSMFNHTQQENRANNVSHYEHYSKSLHTHAPSNQHYSSPYTQTQDPITTGTSVLAIKCKDFVALAADTCVSYGSIAKFRSLERIKQVGDHTFLGASGEYSDFQALLYILEELTSRDKLHDDGSVLEPAEIHSYLTRVMYNRRNNFNPFYNQLIIGGFRNNKSFLGLVDLVGTSFQEETLATGYGAYIARPLLRNGWREDLTQEQAIKLLENCMRVLYYRDARAINKIQIAIVSAEGCKITAPYALETSWLVAESVRPH